MKAAMADTPLPPMPEKKIWSLLFFICLYSNLWAIKK
jgi:hypothetical protein